MRDIVRVWDRAVGVGLIFKGKEVHWIQAFLYGVPFKLAHQTLLVDILIKAGRTGA